jgi:serine/threonine-protein phosphatase 2A regulatory subunit B'
LKSKEIKRAALNELIDYITASKGVIVEALYPEIIRMVSRNSLFLVKEKNSIFLI